MKLISIVTACYNEEDNVDEVYAQVKAVFQELPEYRYEHIFIDNASTDNTVPLLKRIAAKDKNVKIIVNTRNFGHIRSPFHALRQAYGDAVILLVADLQDPPILIKDFIKGWEAGYKVVIGVKPNTQETRMMAFIRRCYYKFISQIADARLIKNFTGFGLYDKQVIDIIRSFDDPYPYFRGLISEIGYEPLEISYNQPRRKRGITKNNFYTLYDMAMLGITSHSKIPLRLATMTGFILSAISLLGAITFFVIKLVFWQHFNTGIAPMLIGLFFFASVQLFFIGMLGEYLLTVHVQVMKRPLVFEKERINFQTTEKDQQ